MSVNTQRDDVGISPSFRIDPPRGPEHHNNIDFNSTHSYRTMGPDASLSTSREWTPQDGKMSPERRTFCLFTTFDLIFTFILWVIYTQLIGISPIWKAFEDQVFDYTFDKSLFDTVMISASRFTFIMLAYALFRISHWWVIAISTSMTCIYLLCKCFIFEFNDSVLGGKNPLSYIVLIVCFILAWIETWMLDFKVIPREKRKQKHNHSNGRESQQGEREPLLGNSNSNATETTNDSYYSPYHTPQGSEDEGENQLYQSVHSRPSHSRKDIDNYNQQLEEAKVAFLEMLDMDNWKQEGGKSLAEGLVFSLYMKKYSRKLFKIQGIIDLPPKELWEDMIATLNDSPKWNPTILESRTVQIIDDQCEITYNIAAEGGGGLVSCRDFVSLRRWSRLPRGTYISASIGCVHPDLPAQKKYVRGDNGPGGWAFDVVEGEPDKCLFTWIVNSNLKGWLPQAAIDTAMSGVLTTYFKLLLQHYREIVEKRQTL